VHHAETGGKDLRTLIEQQRYLRRPPTAGERQALEEGLKALGARNTL
jgi:hypothetical protein